MKKAAGWVLALAAASGCVATETDGFYRAGGNSVGAGGMGILAPQLPGGPALSSVTGPWGEPVAVTPRGVVPPALPLPPMAPVIQASYHPGCNPAAPPTTGYGCGGSVHAMGAIPPGGGAGGPAVSTSRTQIRFAGPAGAQVSWYTASSAGQMVPQLVMPGRYNFAQAAIYRLKVSNIPGRAGVNLFPTIEVVPTNAKTDAFLAHNVVPVEFTEEDLDQIAAGNFITKVIYLPDAQYQSANAGGPEELSSTRLEPGVDPVAEANRRGHILVVIRVGGIDLDLDNSPALNAPGMFGTPHAAQTAKPGGSVPTTPGVTRAGFTTPPSECPPASTTPAGAAPQLPQVPPPPAMFPQTMIPLRKPNVHGTGTGVVNHESCPTGVCPTNTCEPRKKGILDDAFRK